MCLQPMQLSAKSPRYITFDTDDDVDNEGGRGLTLGANEIAAIAAGGAILIIVAVTVFILLCVIIIVLRRRRKEGKGKNVAKPSSVRAV